ncbi:MAG: hypothetical protein KF716_23275 [Anaerolineae bacterium]|nr:hypothetical protein [Anaerolineae bacterium]
MSLPEALTTIAAVGTDKGATLRESDDALEQVIHKRSDLPLEGRILLTAAGLHLQQQAGWLPGEDKRPLPEPCEPDELPTINTQALYHLALMLDGDYLGALPEWLREVQARRLRIPEEALPLILEAGHKHKDLRDLIVPALGNRGIWLAKQASSRQWAWFDLSNADHVWEKGSNEERLDMLEALRKVDPARGRQLVESTWKEDKADQRAFFLNALETGLSMDDEPFLEAALDDRAQDVRGGAVVLLGMLPESRFVQRMIARGLALVELDTSKAGETIFSVHVINKADEALRRDGIELAEGKQRGLNKKQWTHSILNHISPEQWCQHFDLSKEDLFKIAMTADGDEQMVNSLAWGTCRAQDAEFARLLLPAALSQIEVVLHGQLLKMLPNPDRVLVGLLKNRQGMSFEALAPLLKAYDQPWSAELALIVCSQMIVASQTVQTFYLLNSGLRDIPLYFPLNASEELIRRFSAPIKNDSNYGSAWRSGVDRIRTTLDFRREMIAALHT